MDIFEKKEQFDNSGEKFRNYLESNGGPEQLSSKINYIFNYLSEKEIGILAFLFKNSNALMGSILDKMIFEGKITKEEVNMDPPFENINLIMKSMIVLIDSMVYAGYLKEDFFPKNIKVAMENVKTVDYIGNVNLWPVNKNELKKLKEKRDVRKSKKNNKK